MIRKTDDQEFVRFLDDGKLDEKKKRFRCGMHVSHLGKSAPASVSHTNWFAKQRISIL